jgi:excisionase family DNA binding protein
VSQDRNLRISEVCERLAVSRSTVMALIARGEIESLKVGRARRVQQSRLEAWIAGRAAIEARRHEEAVSEIVPETADEAGHRAAAHSE